CVPKFNSSSPLLRTTCILQFSRLPVWSRHPPCGLFQGREIFVSSSGKRANRISFLIFAIKKLHQEFLKGCRNETLISSRQKMSLLTSAATGWVGFGNLHFEPNIAALIRS